MNELVVLIGAPLEGVSIRVRERQFPQSKDFDDANWLESPIEIKVGRFQAVLPAQLRVDEVHSFRVESKP